MTGENEVTLKAQTDSMSNAHFHNSSSKKLLGWRPSLLTFNATPCERHWDSPVDPALLQPRNAAVHVGKIDIYVLLR